MDRVDAVVATYDDGFSSYAGSGDGSFDEGITLGGYTMPSFALGDLNHDGRLDIVADGGSVILVTPSSGVGLGAAGRRIHSWLPFDTSSGTILGDFDNDSNLDVLTWGGTMLFGDGQGALGGTAAVCGPVPTAARARLEPRRTARHRGAGRNPAERTAGGESRAGR